MSSEIKMKKGYDHDKIIEGILTELADIGVISSLDALRIIELGRPNAEGY
jgi:hypothetical protein